MGIPQCHLLQGTRITDNAALFFPVDLTFLTCSELSFPSPQIPAHFVTMPVSMAFFCAVLVVIALHYLFPTLILPFILLFFLWVGVVEPRWFLRHDYPPLPDHWHHLSFKKTSRKFPSESAHDDCSLARGRGERFKPNKALTSFRREPNVLSLQLLLSLEGRDQERKIHRCSV